MSAEISYQDWSDYLMRIGAICGPSEWHGMTIGYLCGNDKADYKDWLKETITFMDLIEEDVNAELRSALTSFCEINAAALTDEHYGLILLLPDDAVGLAARVESLAKWCQGFLHGFALLGEGVGQRLDSEAQDALRDLAQIAQANDEVDNSAANEVHYTELVEYIRLAVFTLYSQLNVAAEVEASAQVPSGPTTH